MEYFSCVLIYTWLNYFVFCMNFVFRDSEIMIQNMNGNPNVNRDQDGFTS